MMKVNVYSESGTVLGTVSRQATSIGASKVAGGQVRLERVRGVYAWVRYASVSS